MRDAALSYERKGQLAKAAERLSPGQRTGLQIELKVIAASRSVPALPLRNHLRRRERPPLASGLENAYDYALQVMSLETSHPIHLSPAARRCLVAVVIYGVVGIVTAFAVVNESTSQIETWLHERFPGSRPDAFKGMNSLMNPWVVSFWVCWTALVPSCWILRRYVSVGVLVAAPMVPSVALLLLDFDFADPNWTVLFGVLTIGAFVGVLSGAVLSMLPPRWHFVKMRSTLSRDSSDTGKPVQ